MTTPALVPVAKALASESSVDDVLDAVDDAIEEAKRRDDAETLTALADLLDATAAERGGDWRRLAIAAMRARATAGAPAAEAPPAPVLPPPVVEPQAQARFAGFWIRTAAFLLDWLLLVIASTVMGGLAAEIDGPLVVLVALFLPLVYFAGMHAWHDGATVGKAVFGLAVQARDGAPVGFGRASARALATAVLWFTVIGGLVDAILLAADAKKQSLHDKIAGTIVVRTRGAPVRV